MLFMNRNRTEQFKVTCLEYANGEFVRVDASNQRWTNRADAEAYAASVSKGRDPKVQVA